MFFIFIHIEYSQNSQLTADIKYYNKIIEGQGTENRNYLFYTLIINKKINKRNSLSKKSLT